MEPNSPKKIQFAVPPFQNQLDPQAAEHIRRRRPTPATLVIYSDPGAAEAEDRRTASNPGEVRSAEPSPPQMDQTMYSPPTMRELQLVMEQHLQKQEQPEVELDSSSGPSGPSVEHHCPSSTQSVNHNGPEPNGNEARVGSLRAAEDSADPTATTSQGEALASGGRQENLSSPSSISR